MVHRAHTARMAWQGMLRLPFHPLRWFGVTCGLPKREIDFPHPFAQVGATRDLPVFDGGDGRSVALDPEALPLLRVRHFAHLRVPTGH